MIFAPMKSDVAHWIAALALVASLYHLLNHAVFKGLLYLATGAIDNQTHQVVEFHKLGGLIKTLPAGRPSPSWSGHFPSPVFHPLMGSLANG